MAQRGGARPGAGRPKGSPNKATQWRQAQVAATGATPLEVMIEAMRHHLAVARQAQAVGDVKIAGAALRQAADLAAQAAPYVHPRLTAVQHSGHNGGPVEVVRRVIVDVQDPGNPDGTGLPAAS